MMAEAMYNREPEMIPIVERLYLIPELSSNYAIKMRSQTEYQEALEVFLLEAVKKNIRLPADLIDDVRNISEELLPKALCSRQYELVPALV